MMKRKIIQIHEDKCVGCGLCVTACHEGAIEMINGKARLVSDQYCDGLGDCLPACPTDAIEMIEREADEYSQEAVDMKMEAQKKAANPFAPAQPEKISDFSKDAENRENFSELKQWPIQLKLVNSGAAFLSGANLLIAADCTAFAYGDFHKNFMKGRVTIIGCPKLDDNQVNIDKLTEIFTKNDIKSVLVTRMEVPCCSGIVGAVKTALQNSKKIIPYAEVTIATDGRIL